MQLTKENIGELQERLVAVRERGKEYFAKADPEKVVETAYPFGESWEIKDAQTLQEGEALRQAIKDLSVDIAAAARVSPLLADADMQDLRHNTRQMLANVYFSEYHHTGVYVHHDEGTVLGVDPPTHEEVLLGDASTAPRRFDQAAAKTLDLTDLLLSTDAAELAQAETAPKGKSAKTVEGILREQFALPDIGKLPVEPAVVPIIENRIEEAHRALEAGAVKCPIWNTPALEEPTDRDGRLVDSSRAGGKYFIAGTAEAVLESHDDHVKARLTSWMIEQRRPENPCPEIDTGTISEAQQRPDPGIPERSDGILRYLETRSDVLGKTVTYNPRPPSLLYDKSFHTLSDEEKEYFRLLAHSGSTNKDDLRFFLDHLNQCGLIKITGFDGGMGGCALAREGYARLDELKKFDAPVKEVERQHGKDVQPLHQLLQVSLAKLPRWSQAGIRTWWKRVATAVVLLAALTTILVNIQVIKGWINADSRLVEATSGDRTRPVQVAPAPNKDADEHATPERPIAGSQTKSLDKEGPDLPTLPPAATESRPAASAGAPPEVPRQPAADTAGPSGDLAELASQIRKDVESMAKPGEKWTVSDGPRISVTLWNPKNPTSGRGHQVDASNRDDLNSVMESLRSYWADRARKDEEYARGLLKK